ncbi:MAG: hypothetical protein HOB86_01895, partial [Rhodospirillaceae bacterium]|nr:hypothetical protein [Rhodospirillaceae bacterium]
MNATDSKARNQILRQTSNEAQRLAGKRGAKLAEKFVRQYYEHVSTTDLAERSHARLAGDAMAMLKLSGRRKPGQIIIDVRDPGGLDAGNASLHSVVDILSDNMPFLLDSSSAELTRLGHSVHLIIHPVYRTRRDKTGKLQDFFAGNQTGAGVQNESMMSITINRQDDPARIKEIEANLQSVLGDVYAAVEDWQAMRAKVQGIIDEFKLRNSEGAVADIAEAQDFLQW